MPRAYDAVIYRNLPTCERDSSGETGTSWVALRRAGSIPDSAGVQFEAQLKFRVVEVDPVSGDPIGDTSGFQEEYPLEDVEMNIGDFIETVRIHHHQQ